MRFGELLGRTQIRPIDPLKSYDVACRRERKPESATLSGRSAAQLTHTAGIAGRNILELSGPKYAGLCKQLDEAIIVAGRWVIRKRGLASLTIIEELAATVSTRRIAEIYYERAESTLGRSQDPLLILAWSLPEPC